MTKLSPKCIRILKTCNLYFCFFIFGLCFSLPGPCLLDLQNMVQTDTGSIGIIYTGRSIGNLLGSVLGGIVLDAVQFKQSVITIGNLIATISILVVPWTKSLGGLISLITINGVAQGVINTGCNVLCLTLWGNDSGPYFQALHLIFGLGAVVAPLVAAPFLANYTEELGTAPDASNGVHPDISMNFTNLSTSHDEFGFLNDGVPSIVYPFSIVGGLSLLVTLMLLTVCIISPVEEEVTQSKKSTQVGKINLGLIYFLIILFSLLLFLDAGIEIGFTQMLTAYVVKNRLHLTPATGSYMVSAFWASFSVGRTASVFIAIKASNLTMIVCDLSVCLVGSFVLLFLASCEWAMWLASVLLGVGIASFYPAVVAWLDDYINLTNLRAAVVFGGGVVGEMLIPLAIGYFFESIPDLVLYTVVSCTVVSCLFVAMAVVILRNKNKK